MVYNNNYPLGEAINDRYRQKFGEDIPELSASGYQLIAIVTGLLEGRTVSRAVVKELLNAGFMYHGVLGPIDVKPGDRDITHDHLPVVITDGKLEFLDVF